MSDQATIRELIQNWALWRDAGNWSRFRTVWHDDGRMNATWFQGSCDDFIQANVEGWNRGVSILHFLGGTAVDIAGDRAVAQTKMTISQRDHVEGVLCDVVSTGRFVDFLERRSGRWGMVLRQPIYEKDRMDPVQPDASLKLDVSLLAEFPESYLRWSRLFGQVGGRNKLGSGCCQAASFSVFFPSAPCFPPAPYASSGVRPAKVEWGRRAL